MADNNAKQKKKFSFARIKNYLKESKSEMKKIVWPSKKQIIKNSVIVIAIILIAGAFISLIDYGFTTLINLLIGLF